MENNKYYFLKNFGSFEVKIVGVFNNSPAKFFGVKPNETILEVDGKKINTLKDLFNSINYSKGYVLIKTNRKLYNISLTINGKKYNKIGILVEEVYHKKTPIIPDLYLFLKRFLFYFGFLSVNLAFVNLFPLFITDGQKIIDLIILRRNSYKLLLISRLFSLILFLILLVSAILSLF